MTVTHKLFKILSGHDVANGRADARTDRQTDGRTDERHTIISLKFYFGHIKKYKKSKIPANVTLT